jgi:hypothetical protein
VAADPIARTAPIGAGVTKSAACLIRNMFRRRHREAGRKIEGRERFCSAQETDGFIHCGDAFGRAPGESVVPNEKLAPKGATHFLEISGIDFGMLPRQIHLAHHLFAARPALMRIERRRGLKKR